MAADPLLLAGEVHRATDRLFSTVDTLDDAAVAAASGLPHWTRGHVLTHIARNADGLVNLLTWARTGVRTAQYASSHQRNADIEAGAPRDADAQRADLRAACARFAAAMEQMSPEAWTHPVTWNSGSTAPAAHIVWARLTEVEVHHVDLAAGYRPGDWPADFTVRTLRKTVEGFADHPSGPRVVIRAAEVGHDLPIGTGTSSPIVSGPAWAAAAWLIGRSPGTGLDISPTGPLPPVPSWG